MLWVCLQFRPLPINFGEAGLPAEAQSDRFIRGLPRAEDPVDEHHGFPRSAASSQARTSRTSDFAADRHGARLTFSIRDMHEDFGVAVRLKRCAREEVPRNNQRQPPQVLKYRERGEAVFLALS